MTTTPTTETYTYGLGELIRAHRAYLGATQQGMAILLQMDRRDYQRVEKDDDACPPGLVDRVLDLADKFDDEVDAVVEAATAQGGARLIVSDDPHDSWQRAVVQRAAVVAPYGLITPTLSG